ncbi:hypothetical protein IC619_003390 [Hazenella sp. IB182353]|uniref:hypothetical protein n=1 Tax=Polycladospora coralii TaxID=2771432 RepID=UPI001746FB4B|nr:hypothetical protein [Polycladospora coralii]MBS7529539.1 hypothetical protein [Polycladospora coralii]
MIQLQVKGLVDQVYTFITDLCNRPHVEFIKSKVNVRKDTEANVVLVIDHQPAKRTKCIVFHMDHGDVVIPLLDVVHAELESQQIITGKSTLDPMFTSERNA